MTSCLCKTLLALRKAWWFSDENITTRIIMSNKWVINELLLKLDNKNKCKFKHLIIPNTTTTTTIIIIIIIIIINRTWTIQIPRNFDDRRRRRICWNHSRPSKGPHFGQGHPWRRRRRRRRVGGQYHWRRWEFSKSGTFPWNSCHGNLFHTRQRREIF